MRGRPRRRRRAPAMRAGSRLTVMLLLVKNCFAASSAFSFTTSSCASSKEELKIFSINIGNFAEFLRIEDLVMDLLMKT